MIFFTVSFFRHRQIAEPLAMEQRLKALIRELILTKDYAKHNSDGAYQTLQYAKKAGANITNLPEETY